MDEDEALARAIAASLEDQKGGAAAPSEGGEGATGEGAAGDKGAGKEAEAEAEAPKLSLKEREALMRAKLEEVKRKKEEEERELERVREQERIRSGKELIAQKRLLEDQERQRVIDFRKREKEEAKRAKQKILEEIARDKAERRSGQSGQPPPAPEKKVEKKQSDSPWDVKPVSVQTDVRDLLVKIKKVYPKEQADVAFKTINAYCLNLLKQPVQEKFRQIRKSNAAFQQRVVALEGGEGCRVLELVGFRTDVSGEFYKMEEANFNKRVVEAACTELNNAMTNPFFGAL